MIIPRNYTTWFGMWRRSSCYRSSIVLIAPYFLFLQEHAREWLNALQNKSYLDIFARARCRSRYSSMYDTSHHNSRHPLTKNFRDLLLFLFKGTKHQLSAFGYRWFHWDFLCVDFWQCACGDVSNLISDRRLPSYISIPKQWAIETYGSPQPSYVSSHVNEHSNWPDDGCLTQVLLVFSEFGKT